MFFNNSIVLLFTGFALFQTWRHYKVCMFEMMPLSINFLVTFILLNLKLFEKSYEFQYIGYLIEIFMYFLFCYTFAIMCTLISKPDERRKVKIIWNAIMLVMLILLIVFSILVFADTISKKCRKETEEWPGIIGLVFQFLFFILTVFYGVKIIHKMTEKQERGVEDQTNMSSFNSEIYIQQRKKQIIMVLVAQLYSLIFRIVLSLMTVFMWNSLIQCNQIDGVFIVTSKKVAGQFFLVMTGINELLPHVAIPFAMYVIPLQKITRTKSIRLHEGLLDKQEDYDSNHTHEEQVQNRVSTLLTSRLSEDGSPIKKSLKDRNIENVIQIESD